MDIKGLSGILQGLALRITVSFGFLGFWWTEGGGGGEILNP